MVFPDTQEIWFIVLYILLTGAGFTLALYLADPYRRFRAAWVGGLLVLILASVLSMLAVFAATQLQSGPGMLATFQLVGVGACLMAVSRVSQILTWGRTWLAAIYGLMAYIGTAMLISWLLTLAQR